MDLGVVIGFGVLLLLNVISIICLYTTKAGKDYMVGMDSKKKAWFTVYMVFVGITFWIAYGIGELLKKIRK